AFIQWMIETMDRKAPVHSGQIIAVDNYHQDQGRVDFYNALITEIGFPALDGAVKSPDYFTIKIQPEQIKREPATGNVLKLPPIPPPSIWQQKNFQFSVQGLEQASSTVLRIDPFTVTQSSDTPGLMNYPDIIVHLPAASGQPFFDWYQDFVLNGNNG